MKTQSLRLATIFTLLFLGFSSLTKTSAQCPSCASCIVINEFSVDPLDGDNGSACCTGEFIEIYNRCNESVNIGCFVLCLTDATSGGRGDCITIPSGTSLAPGGVYVFGGYGTNCSGGAADCDFDGLTLNYNWHSGAKGVWNVAGNAFFTGNSGNYIGVLQDSGEEISLFDACGSFLNGVKYNGGSGTYSTTENIGAISGCAAKSLTINSANNVNLGSSSGVDEGWTRNCNGTWSFANASAQNPGASEGCTTVTCVTPLSISDLTLFATAEKEKNIITLNYPVKDAEKFIVEKSTNGKDFNFLTEIIPSENLERYSIEDNSPYTTTFYRVVVILKNGLVEYTKSVAVKNNNQKGFYINNLYPNPATNYFSFDFDLNLRGETVSLKLINTLGELVFETSLNQSEHITVNTDGFETGIYFLMLSSGNDIQKHKLIITK